MLIALIIFSFVCVCLLAGAIVATLYAAVFQIWSWVAVAATVAIASALMLNQAMAAIEVAYEQVMEHHDLVEMIGGDR